MSKRDLEKALEEARSRINELEDILRSSTDSSAENRYKTLFEHTGTPVCVLKEDGIIIACNKEFSDFFGHAKNEIEGLLPWMTFVIPNEIDRVNGYAQARIAGDKSVPSVYRTEVRRGDGSIRKVICSVGMIPDSDERVASLIDITELKNTEQTLREREELHTAVIEKSKDGIAIIQNARITFVNNMCARMSGYSENDLLGARFSDLIAHNDRARIIDAYRNKLTGEEVAESIQLRLLRPDGETSQVEVLYSSITSDGQDALLLTIRDISERLAEDKRKLEQSQIESAIIDQSPVGISVRDRNGNLLLCNEKWAEIWNKPAEDVQALLDRKQDELALDNRDSYLGNYREDVVKIYTEGGDLTVPDLYIKSLDKWLTQRFYGILNPSGDIGKVVVLTEDVTEEKRARSAEEALKRSDEKYEILVNNLPVAVFRSGMDGHLFSVNSTMLSMFAADSEKKLLNTRVEDLYLDSTDRMTFKESLSQFGQLDNYEVQLRRLDGSTFWASISAYGVKDGSGKIEAIDGIIRDISEIRELEEEILKRQRLESIGILAGGIAHDFNNILAAVLGNISLAKTYTNTTHPVYSKLDAAEKASVRASELTQQLLTFSRGGEPVKRLLHMDRILREASDFATRGSNVKCNVSVPESTWSVKADEGQIGQVISNLVINSMQAMPEGGIVDLVVENQQLSTMNSMSLDAGNYVTISVIDHGRGIAKENIDRIFDPYFTTKSEGSGLGLATVYSIVGRHGGQITVNSVEGDGSTFTVYLPASDQRHQQTISNTIEIARGSGTILVMDDEESVQAVIQEMLAQYGYKTEQALDGLSAVKLYKTAMDAGQKFDAVIMDLTIPGGMGGVESLARIIELDPDVRAIVSSGYSNGHVLANFTDYGFKACISKPFRLEELLSTLQSALCSE